MRRALLAAMLAAALGPSTGCRVVDTVLLGRPCDGGRGPCGTVCDPCAHGGSSDCGCGDACGSDCGDACGSDCGDSCGGACGGCCHSCPLFEIFGFLHPDRILCVWEYRDCDGCGDRYWGDWYRGERAGCESCDCHGNWTGPGGGSYVPGHSHAIEEHASEPTPAEAAPKPKVSPGPEQGAATRRTGATRTAQNRSVVSARATKSKQAATHLRPVDSDAEWTARRGR